MNESPTRKDMIMLHDSFKKIIQTTDAHIGHIIIEYIMNIECNICKTNIDFKTDAVYFKTTHPRFIFIHEQIHPSAKYRGLDMYHHKCIENIPYTYPECGCSDFCTLKEYLIAHP